MFNPMEPPQLLQALAQVLREAAGESKDDYRRSQLLSAYSLSRHLAAEEAAAPALAAWFRERLDQELAASAAPAATVARAELSDPAGAAPGPVLARLFGALGEGEGEGEDEALRTRLHALLADLTDREVAVLAAAEA